MPRTIHITPAEWAQIPDNPIQRDTVSRAEKAKKYLKNGYETAECVHAAIYPNGKMVKLDGHTRSYLWQQRAIPVPDMIAVTLYRVKTEEDVIELYKHFDSGPVHETANDKLFGAFRLARIDPISPLLTHGGIYTAFTLMGHDSRFVATNLYRIIAEWRRELLLLDQLGFTAHKFPAPFITAALLTFRRYGAAATRFWQAYIADEGRREAGLFDGVDEVSRLFNEGQAKKLFSRSSGNERKEIISYILACFERYQTGKMFKVAARPVKLADYLKESEKDRRALSTKLRLFKALGRDDNGEQPTAH